MDIGGSDGELGYKEIGQLIIGEHVSRPPTESAAMAKRRGESKQGDESDAGLADLPQVADEVWQADIRRVPAWIRIAGVLQRPWMIFVTNRTCDQVLAHAMPDDAPDAEMLWRNLAAAMGSPLVGEPHRPVRIELRNERYRSELAPALDRIGVASVVRPDLDHVDFVLDDLARELSGGSRVPSLLDAPGMKRRQVGRYYTAAASFYRRRPWEQVTSDRPIRVECGKFHSGPWYAVVMGQSGMVFGAALHEGEDGLEQILTGGEDEAESIRRTSAISLMYSEQFEIAVKDLDASEVDQWEVAGPHAFPLAIRLNPGRAVRALLTWELELLEACLWAIPDFLEAGDVPEARVRVPSLGEDLELLLSWPRC